MLQNANQENVILQKRQIENVTLVQQQTSVVLQKNHLNVAANTRSLHIIDTILAPCPSGHHCEYQI